MNLQQFLQIATHNFFVELCRQIMKAIRTLFCCSHVFEHDRNICYFYYIQCSRNKQKFNNKKFPQQALMYQNSFMCLCTQFLSNLYKKFQVHDTNIQYQIRCFWRNLFFSYANNRHTHRTNAKNMIFRFWGSHNM